MVLYRYDEIIEVDNKKVNIKKNMTSKITISPKFNLMDIFRMPISKRNNNYHLYKSGRYSLYYALGNIKKSLKK